jgi:hypothetical protein
LKKGGSGMFQHFWGGSVKLWLQVSVFVLNVIVLVKQVK